MPRKRLKVLIVDDAALVVRRLSASIGEVKVVSKVFTAGTYDEAALLIGQKHPQIVLLDIHLPQKSGIELLGHIRANHPGVITIMLTNLVGDNYRNLCGQLGANHFIDKSGEFENINGIIESYA